MHPRTLFCVAACSLVLLCVVAAEDPGGANQTTAEPTAEPSAPPSVEPSTEPTGAPTVTPSADPSSAPTGAPSAAPTSTPTLIDSSSPSSSPTATPTTQPTADATTEPSVEPSAEPSTAPTANPTLDASEAPTPDPTAEPTPDPSSFPTAAPSWEPQLPLFVYRSPDLEIVARADNWDTAAGLSFAPADPVAFARCELPAGRRVRLALNATSNGSRSTVVSRTYLGLVWLSFRPVTGGLYDEVWRPDGRDLYVCHSDRRLYEPTGSFCRTSPTHLYPARVDPSHWLDAVICRASVVLVLEPEETKTDNGRSACEVFPVGCGRCVEGRSGCTCSLTPSPSVTAAAAFLSTLLVMGLFGMSLWIRHVERQPLPAGQADIALGHALPLRQDEFPPGSLPPGASRVADRVEMALVASAEDSELTPDNSRLSKADRTKIEAERAADREQAEELRQRLAVVRTTSYCTDALLDNVAWCGALLFVWAVVVLRLTFVPPNNWAMRGLAAKDAQFVMWCLALLWAVGALIRLGCRAVLSQRLPSLQRVAFIFGEVIPHLLWVFLTSEGTFQRGEHGRDGWAGAATGAAIATMALAFLATILSPVVFGAAEVVDATVVSLRRRFAWIWYVYNLALFVNMVTWWAVLVLPPCDSME